VTVCLRQWWLQVVAVVIVGNNHIPSQIEVVVSIHV
jgi:hypothetical protein